MGGEALMASAPQRAGAQKPPALARRDGVFGFGQARALLDLDERQNRAAERHKIDFAGRRARAPLQDAPARQAKAERCERFSPPSAPLGGPAVPRFSHAGAVRGCPRREARLAWPQRIAGPFKPAGGVEKHVMIAAVSRTTPLTPRRILTALAALAALAAAACETPGPAAPVETAPRSPVTGAPPEPAALPVGIAEPAYTPPHMEGRPITRVALLQTELVHVIALERHAPSLHHIVLIPLGLRLARAVRHLP